MTSLEGSAAALSVCDEGESPAPPPGAVQQETPTQNIAGVLLTDSGALLVDGLGESIETGS